MWGKGAGSWGNKQPQQQQQWGASQQWGGQSQYGQSAQKISPITPGKGAKAAAAPVVKDHTAELKVKVDKLTKEVETVEKVTNTTMESAKTVLENEKATAGALKAALESVEKQKTKLNDLVTKLSTESTEVRKLGAKYNAQSAEVMKLTAKLRTLVQAAAATQNKLKVRATKAQAEADLKAKEVKDAAAFKAVLAKAKADLTSAEKAAEEVTKKAMPLISKPLEDGEEKDKKVAAIETAATEAMKKVEAARTDMNEKQKAVTAYAPEAKKTAQAAFLEIQKKVGDVHKALNIYKTFKTQLPRLIENQKNVTEISEQLSGHEAAIAKATDVAKATTLTKAKIEQIDEHLDPIKKILQSVNGPLAKLSNADAVTREKAAKLKTKADDLKKKIDGVLTKIKEQRDVIQSEAAVETAKELLAKCESVWKECQDAELPFLMGVEVLASEENEKALTACKDASVAATAAMSAAKGHCQKKLTESKAYAKELAASTAKELSEVLKEVNSYDTKFAKFKKELNERKVLPVISDAMDAVEKYGKKVKETEALGKALSASGLEDQSVAKITETIESVKKSLADTSANGSEARTLAQKKQRESGASQTHPSIVQMTQDLQHGQDALSKLRSAVQKAETLLKTKNAVTSGEEKTKEAEASCESVKKAVPKGDFTVETVKSFDEACAAAFKAVKMATSVVQPYVGAATAKIKPELEKLLERNKAAQAAITEVKTANKDAREKALSTHYLAEAETKTKAAEDAAKKMEDAESPFLIGTSMPNAKATKEVLAKCTEAAKVTTEAASAANSYKASKAHDIKQFGETASKALKEGLEAIGERLKKIQEKLSSFAKDSKDRAKECNMVEANELTDEIEALGKKTLAALEPFAKEDADKMTEAEAEAPLKAYDEANSETSKKMTALTNFLSLRLKEQTGNKENTEIVKKLQERVTKLKEELVEKRKPVAPHEKRALGKKLLAEAKEEVGGLDAEVKKATTACAELLEAGGEQFLIGNSCNTLANALQAYMKEKDVSVSDVFTTVKKGKTAGEKDFIKWLTEFPETSGRDELSAFSEERRQAMFKRIASSSKGVSAEDFGNILKQEYIVSKAVSLTDKFETEGSETLEKLESGKQVVAFGRHKADEAGLIRTECKVGDKQGWVTIKQDKGAVYLSYAPSPFKVFCSTMDASVRECSSAVQKVAASIAFKLKQGGPAEEGPLKEAREEMTKLKEEVTKATKAMDELKKKCGEARNKYQKTEAAEKSAHIEARNAREAAPFLAEPKAKFEAVEASSKAAEEAAAPLVSLTGDELAKFATPAAVLEAVEQHAAAVKEKAEAARESIKEQRKAATEATPQSGGTTEAKKQLGAMGSKLEEMASKAKKTVAVLAQKCKSLTTSKMDPVAVAIRDAAHKKGKTIEELFVSMAKGDKIPEEAFCKFLAGLEVEGATLSADLSKLVCRKLEADGISKETFMKYVVIYYKVVRTIAFTDQMDITKCTTLRKGDEGEIVEVLEGPVTDAANGMTRVRCKATKKDDKTTGWITVSGSKGTAFLEKASKPAA